MKSFFSVVCQLFVLVYCPSTVFSGVTKGLTPQLPTCQSKIYCASNLLHDIQTSQIFADSKSFIDKKLLFTETEILNKYNILKTKYNDVVPKNELINFIYEIMVKGDELDEWIPPDFTDHPKLFAQIRDENYKNWAFKLNRLWKTLARKVKDDVKTNPDKYSLIWVPNGFFLSGLKFRELNYWDTYWIVNGLLLCDMASTAKGVIDNLVWLLTQYGYVPYGGRVYYLSRSQPPLLTMMALNYYRVTNDIGYIKKILPQLEMEFGFWFQNRMVTFPKGDRNYTMARYYAPSKGPRPEFYRQDFELAQKYNNTEKKEDFFTRVNSASETGWYFSSRWFIPPNGSGRGQYADVQPHNIVPVDLNCILHVNSLALSKWFKIIGDHERAVNYRIVAQDFLLSIHDVMWRQDKGSWFDWDIINSKHREYFFVSNLMPLWTDCYYMSKEVVASAVLGYLKNENIIDQDYNIKFKGTPASMYTSSQLFDFPNALAPLQAIIIQGLDKTYQKQAQQVAKKMADVWLRSNYKGFAETYAMFENYDVLAEGKQGKPFSSQIGYGWTIGFVFELLYQYGDTLSSV